MRIEQLEYLVEISRRKSFNSASEHLFLTPQSLSRSITSMENELGFKLFERNSQGVRFTPEGKRFLETARNITEEYAIALKEISAYNRRVQESCAGKLIIYAHPVFTTSILPGAIAGFCREYPKISVCLLEEVSGGILKKLLEGETAEDTFKIGLVTIPQASAKMQKRYKEQEHWRFIPLMAGEYVCCVSKNSELALKRNISLKTVCQYPLVRFTDNDGDASDVQSYFLEAYGKTSTSFSTTSISSWISAIANDMGIGLIHNVVLSEKSQTRDDFGRVTVLPIREKTALEAGLLVPENSQQFIHTFASFMQQYLKI